MDHKHGYVNLGSGWRRTKEERGDYGEAYHRAAKTLARVLGEDPAHDPFDALPIVFLYRHAIELYLKGILWAGARLLSLKGRQPTFKTFKRSDLDSHSLKPILSALQELFKELDWSESYEEIAPFVESLDKADPDSFAYRYPTKTKKQGGGAALPESVEFNVLEFAEEADACLEALYNASHEIDHRTDITKDMLE